MRRWISDRGNGIAGTLAVASTLIALSIGIGIIRVHRYYFPYVPRSGQRANYLVPSRQVGIHVNQYFSITPLYQQLVLQSGVDHIGTHYSSDTAIWQFLQPQGPDQPYRWDAIARLEGTIHWARDNNLDMHVYVIGGPLWARTGTNSCSPIKQEFWPNYVNVLNALADRYPSVDRWFVWNEPDVKAGQPPVPPPSGYEELFPLPKVRPLLIYGCWGQTPDLWWDFFLYVRKNATVQVHPGGFIAASEKNLNAFLQPVFRRNIPFTDIFFHHYEYADKDGNRVSGWPLRDKITYLKKVFPPDVRLHLNETNSVHSDKTINTGPACADPPFARAQAQHIKELPTYDIAGFTVWEMDSFWRCTSLTYEGRATLTLLEIGRVARSR